jgi:hypothetical protein
MKTEYWGWLWVRLPIDKESWVMAVRLHAFHIADDVNKTLATLHSARNEQRTTNQ